MLSIKYILKCAQDREKYGPGEDTFSPAYHLENPIPAHEIGQPALRAQATINDLVAGVTIQIRHAVDAEGNLRLVQQMSDQTLEAKS